MQNKCQKQVFMFLISLIHFMFLLPLSMHIETTKNGASFGISLHFWHIVALKDDDPKPTGIKNINQNTIIGQHYYSLDGKRINQPQRGLNIIKMNDGTTRKVVVK